LTFKENSKSLFLQKSAKYSLLFASYSYRFKVTKIIITPYMYNNAQISALWGGPYWPRTLASLSVQTSPWPYPPPPNMSYCVYMSTQLLSVSDWLPVKIEL
jgi:hypothetical protein